MINNANADAGLSRHQCAFDGREAALCYEAFCGSRVCGSSALQLKFCQQPLPPLAPPAWCALLPTVVATNQRKGFNRTFAAVGHGYLCRRTYMLHIARQ